METTGLFDCLCVVWVGMPLCECEQLSIVLFEKPWTLNINCVHSCSLYAETWTSMQAVDQKIHCRTMHYIGWMILNQLNQPFTGDEWLQRLHRVSVPAARLARPLPLPVAVAEDEDGWTIVFVPEDD